MRPNSNNSYLLTHLLNTSFEGASSPPNGITDMDTMSVLSFFARTLILINAAVDSPGDRSYNISSLS